MSSISEWAAARAKETEGSRMKSVPISRLMRRSQVSRGRRWSDWDSNVGRAKRLPKGAMAMVRPEKKSAGKRRDRALWTERPGVRGQEGVAGGEEEEGRPERQVKEAEL